MEEQKKVEKLTLKGFIDEVADVSVGPHPRKFCFVLGAGASKSSGIKSGQDLVEIWDKELTERNPQEHIEWKASNGIEENNKASFYSEFYERRFLRQPADGYNYLEKIMETAKPSIGYVMLSHILTETNNNVVVTTNFDHLVEDAVNYYTRKIPMTIGHEVLAHYVSKEINRPTIIKIHRDLLLDPRNSTTEVNKLHDNWKDVLSIIFSQYHPIFIGYAGNDNSLMDFLLDNSKKFYDGDWAFPYWLVYKNEPTSEKVINFLEQSRGYIIKHNGFDEVLYRLGAKFDYKLPTKEEFLEDPERRFQDLSDYVDEFTEKMATDKDIPQGQNNIVKKEPEEYSEILEAIQKITEHTEGQRLFSQAVQLGNEGKHDEAREIKSRLVELEPENARYHNSLGETLDELECYEDSLKEKQIAIELEPENAQYYASLGDSLYKMERYEEALEKYQIAVERDEEYPYNYSNMGRILDALERYDEALEVKKIAIEKDPRWAWFYYELGYTLCKMERYEDGLLQINKAIELETEYAWYYFEKGDALCKLERYEEALTEIQKAIELESDKALYYILMSKVLHALGRKEEGKKAVEKAIELDPDVEWYKDVLKDME